MGKFNFKPFDKVLVRSEKKNHWEIDFFGRIDKVHENHYVGTAGCSYVECIPYNDETAHLLGTTDDYVEPWTPKDGDFVVSGWKKGDRYCHWIAICRDYDNDELFYKTYAILHVRYSSNNGIKEPLEVKYDVCDGHDYTRPATEEEKQFLLSKLAEIGKKWNPEKKCIEDVWTPQDGDFVYVKSTYDHISIYKNKDANGVIIYADLLDDVLVPHECIAPSYIKELRPATDTEKQQLLDALHKENKDWDAEKKEIVEYKWKPEEGAIYYFVSDFYYAGHVTWCEANCFDKARYELGNCFRTEAEAQAMADKFKELLKGK